VDFGKRGDGVTGHEQWKQAELMLIQASQKALAVLHNDICQNRNMPAVPLGIWNAQQIGVEAEPSPGVYFLWSGLLCVYVGMSHNVRKRLMTHVMEAEKFDPEYGKASALYFSEHEARYAELFYIWLLRPCNNDFSQEAARHNNQHRRQYAESVVSI
jgi:hypothetical protein